MSDKSRQLLRHFGYPEPKTSFAESTKQKLAYRNHFNLYNRSCDFSGQNILSIVPPFMPFKVYEKSIWFGDSWNALEYARDYDFNRGFFEQFYELQKDVPIFNLQNVNSENCDYCTSVSNAKNCYLAFAVYNNSEDIYYGYNTIGSRDVYFSNFSTSLENCFYCFSCKNCYNNVGTEYCFNSNFCYFSYSLDSCSNCLFSSNLKNKQYVIFNQEYPKTEYLQKLQDLKLNTYSGLQYAFKIFQDVKLKAVTRAHYQLNCSDCLGNELVNCNNCQMCFNANYCESYDESLAATYSKDCFRCHGSVNAERCYETCGVVSATNCSFIIYGYSVYDCHYCINIHNCTNCFGCVGIQNQSYCIFNKQYSKNAYQETKQKIIDQMKTHKYMESESKEWGSYFPACFSYVPYNLSLAMVNWPLTKQSALETGYLWHHEDLSTTPKKDIYLPPEDIQRWDDNLEGKALMCDQSKKAFRIIPKVIQKFKKENLHIIHEHPVDYVKRKVAEVSYEVVKRRSAKSNKMLDSTFHESCFPQIFSEEEYQNEFF